MLIHKNKKVFLFTLATTIVISLVFYFVQTTQAQDKKRPEWTIPSPEIKISDKIHFSEPQICGVKNGDPVYCIPWLGEYINEIYNWGIGAVGIVAALGMIIGGLIWLTAGGNMSKVGEAKTWISSSLLGLLLALGAYSILYQINPNLTIFKPLKIVAPQGGELPQMNLTSRYYNCSYESLEPGECSAHKLAVDDKFCQGQNVSSGIVATCCCQVKPEPTCIWKTACGPNQIKIKGEKDSIKRCGTEYTNLNSQSCCCLPSNTNDTCQLYPVDSKGVINFSTNSSVPLPKKCNDYDFSNHYNVPERILKAIAATESACNPNVESGAGACGMMQLLPSTAKLVSGRKDITCEELKKNWKFSIELAAKYIHDNANVHHNDIIKVFAGYNSGYTPQTSRNGKKPALAPSSDCPGALAFECCINPGGLAETQRYVFTAIKYYKGQ